MFEKLASVWNKSSAQNEQSNILNSFKMPMIGTFITGVSLIVLALFFFRVSKVLGFILFGVGLLLWVVCFIVLLCMYMHFYMRSYNENPNQLYSEKFKNDQALIGFFGEKGDLSKLKLPQSEYLCSSDRDHENEGGQS